MDLLGETLNFGDQLKEYQTIFAATDALKGDLQYRALNWSNFVGVKPVIEVETVRSVDLGDMAETPTVFAQSAGDPVKVVAITQGASPKTSPYDIVVPAGSPIKTAAQLKGQTVAVQEGTVEQYFLVQYLAKNHIPYSAFEVGDRAVPGLVRRDKRSGRRCRHFAAAHRARPGHRQDRGAGHRRSASCRCSAT